MISKAHPYLLDVFRDRFAPQYLRGKSKHTQKLHRTTLEWFERSIGHRATPKDLTDENAAIFLHWVETQPGRNGKPRDPRTINNRRSYFFCFWRWCARKGLVPTWPDVAPLPEPEKNPTAWKLHEIAEIFRACRQSGDRPVKGVGSDIPAKYWWQALHYIWWDTGERTSATLAIKLAWIDFETGTLHIPAAYRKGRKKPATYRLKAKTLAMLNKIREPQRELLFDFQQSDDLFYKRYEELLQYAGLPFDRTCKPQKMRRSFATHLEAAGGNATEALNHSRRSITKQSYLDQTIIAPDSQNNLLCDF